MYRILRRTVNISLLKQLENQLLNKNCVNSANKVVSAASVQHNLTLCRYKSKTTKKQQVSDSEEEERNNAEDTLLDKHTKAANISVQSLRLDGVLKSGLGIARNKIETLFYESKIRLNGQKVLKKSVTVGEGDEIDIIKGPSPANPDFLIVARLEIVEILDTGESIKLKVRRAKALTIENYPQ